MKQPPSIRLNSSFEQSVLSSRNSWYGIFLAALLGALAPLGFAPLYWFPLTALSLAALFWLWQHAGNRLQAATFGFAYGLGFFGVGVSWIYISLHDYGAMPAVLAAIATFLLCAFLSLAPALVGFFASLVARGVVRRLVLIPALWVLMEWVRGWIFTGFPWLAVGYSQAPIGPLVGFAPLVGVYGVSLTVAVSAAILAEIAEGLRAAKFLRWRWVAGLTALWMVGWGLQQIAWTHPVGTPVTVSLLQGNIPQELKWREDKMISTLDTYRAMTLASTSRLIILPETAVPLFADNVPQDFLAILIAHARANQGDVLIGLPERIGVAEYYNSVLSFGTAPIQTYRKFHLVPFGEYIPMKPVFGWIINVLQIPLSDFSRGATVQIPMQIAGQKVALNICYEDVFGEEIIRQLPAATVLVNVSNDAWFGASSASRQHLQISQMRAIETGRYMLRATNTGVTAIIDQRGRVVQRVPEFVTTVLNGTAQGYQGMTPFAHWGNRVVLAMIALMLAAGIIWQRRHGKTG